MWVTGSDIKLTLFVFSIFFRDQYYRCDLTQNGVLGCDMQTPVSVLECSFTMSPPSSCFAVVWYNFFSVLFPLCLPSSSLDTYFGKIAYFPIAVVVLTAVGLSDELCGAKPGALVAASFSARSCFPFWKGFCFVFIIMFTAALQLYCLMEPATRTQKVKAEVQLVTR